MENRSHLTLYFSIWYCWFIENIIEVIFDKTSNNKKRSVIPLCVTLWNLTNIYIYVNVCVIEKGSSNDSKVGWLNNKMCVCVHLCVTSYKSVSIPCNLHNRKLLAHNILFYSIFNIKKTSHRDLKTYI